MGDLQNNIIYQESSPWSAKKVVHNSKFPGRANKLLQ